MIMRNLLYCTILFITAIFSAGCESGSEQNRLTAAEKDSLRRADSMALKIGVMPTEDCLPILVAKSLGLFEKNGVDVHLRRYHALSECRKALTDSLVEGAAIDSTLMSQLNGKTPWLYSGIATSLSWKFFTSKKARIRRIDQLGDKMIAADSHGESHRLAEKAIDSLQRKKEHVFIIQVEDPNVRLSMLTTGNVDAAFLPEPYASKAIKAGAHHITSIKSNPAGVVAFRTTAMAHPDRKKQQQAFIKALKTANDSISRYGKETYNRLLQW